MSPEVLKIKLGSSEQVNLIDVREPYEYEECNLGAQLIPLGDLLHRINELEPFKDQLMVLHCQSGNRSAAAKEVLTQMGFTRVEHLEGGIKAWIECFGVPEISM